jgi:hypothetical protein
MNVMELKIRNSLFRSSMSQVHSLLFMRQFNSLIRIWDPSQRPYRSLGQFFKIRYIFLVIVDFFFVCVVVFSAINASNASSLGERLNLVLWFNLHYPIAFNKLPEDVRRHIAVYLSVPALSAFAETNRANCAFVRSKEAGPLWRRHFRCNFAEYPNLPVLRISNDPNEQRKVQQLISRKDIDEDAVTLFSGERDWRQFFIDATMIMRKNNKLKRMSPRERKPLKDRTSLPPRVALIRDYKLPPKPTNYYPPPDPRDAAITKVDEDGGRRRPKMKMPKKCKPVIEYEYVFAEELVFDTEVGEFFLVDDDRLDELEGGEEFFSMPENRISYTELS